VSKPEWRDVRVTRKQARDMAQAIWYLEQNAIQLAEIAHVEWKPSVKSRLALMEIRRRLYVAAIE
jgi:hypothetical protein